MLTSYLASVIQRCTEGCETRVGGPCLTTQPDVTFLYSLGVISTLILIPGAHDPERGGHPASGQTSKYCPAHRGGGHVQRTLSGHGAGQGVCVYYML